MLLPLPPKYLQGECENRNESHFWPSLSFVFFVFGEQNVKLEIHGQNSKSFPTRYNWWAHTHHGRFLGKYFLFISFAVIFMNETYLDGEYQTIDSHLLLRCRGTFRDKSNGNRCIVEHQNIYFHNTCSHNTVQTIRECSVVFVFGHFHSVFVLFESTKRCDSLDGTMAKRSNNFRFYEFIQLCWSTTAASAAHKKSKESDFTNARFIRSVHWCWMYWVVRDNTENAWTPRTRYSTMDRVCEWCEMTLSSNWWRTYSIRLRGQRNGQLHVRRKYFLFLFDFLAIGNRAHLCINAPSGRVFIFLPVLLNLSKYMIRPNRFTSQ